MRCAIVRGSFTLLWMHRPRGESNASLTGSFPESQFIGSILAEELEADSPPFAAPPSTRSTSAPLAPVAHAADADVRDDESYRFTEEYSAFYYAQKPRDPRLKPPLRSVGFAVDKGPFGSDLDNNGPQAAAAASTDPMAQLAQQMQAMQMMMGMPPMSMPPPGMGYQMPGMYAPPPFMVSFVLCVPNRAAARRGRGRGRGRAGSFGDDMRTGGPRMSTYNRRYSKLRIRSRCLRNAATPRNSNARSKTDRPC